jgi:hypothetical protein
MEKRRDDYVNIRLNAKGLELAAGGKIRIAEGHRAFSFEAGDVVEVTRDLEWQKILEPRGLFELVEGKVVKPAPAAPLAKTSVPEES